MSRVDDPVKNRALHLAACRGQAPLSAAVLVGRLLLAIALSTSCAEPRRSVPVFRVVAEQGMVRSVVVSPAVAADDSALLAIADSLLPAIRGRAVMLQVWTDEPMVPSRIESMSDAQLAARKAVVTVNLNTRFREVKR